MASKGDALLRRGSTGEAVEQLQRRLSELGYFLVPDGIFGPATQAAVCAFQHDHGLAVDGIVGVRTRRALASALASGSRSSQDGTSNSPLPNNATASLEGITLEFALAELAAGACEQGGNNRGPWVKKYMGEEGLPWCVAFATWCFRQACARRGREPAVRERWSSSRLVKEAKSKGLLIKPGTQDEHRLAPGHFFVMRGGPTGYRHTGLIRELGFERPGGTGAPVLAHIRTVEGNTRIPGEGAPDRVVSRFRGVSKLVFVRY